MRKAVPSGTLTVAVLLAVAIIMGWWALGIRQTRAGGPPATYAGLTGQVEDVSGPVAFVDVSVITMDSEEILPRHTVLVEDGKITAIGPFRSTRIPGGIHRVDGRGRYLTPGLTDAHTHISFPEDLLPYVANGVTTIVNMGGEPDVPILEWRAEVARGERLGPTIFAARFVDGSREDGPGHAYLVSSEEQARAAVVAAKAEGFDLIKAYNSLPLDLYLALLDEAAAQGIAVVGHGVREPGMSGILEAGQVMIVHAEEYLYTHFNRTTDSRLIPSAIEMTLDAGAYVVPNLSAYEVIARQWGSRAVLDDFLAMSDLKYAHPFWREYWARGRYLDREGSIMGRLDFLRRLTGEFNDAGIPLLLGTDSPPIPGMIAGFSIHDDLRNLAMSGLSPYEALEAGTRNAGEFFARYVPGSEPFGTIAVGQRADMILLEDNPLEDAANLARRSGVMVRGRWLSEARLQQLMDELARSFEMGESEAGLDSLRD